MRQMYADKGIEIPVRQKTNTVMTHNASKDMVTSAVALYMPPDVKVSYGAEWGTEDTNIAGDISAAMKELANSEEEGILDMPQWNKKEVAKLRKTFAMYVKFPKSRWDEIKKAEDDPEIHSKLSAEFVDTFWSEPDADLREAAKGLF